MPRRCRVPNCNKPVAAKTRVKGHPWFCEEHEPMAQAATKAAARMAVQGTRQFLEARLPGAKSFFKELDTQLAEREEFPPDDVIDAEVIT